MTEQHLHYIWKNRLFDTVSIGNEHVKVLKVGKHNLCDGPDFELARLSWQGIEWCGAVEIHKCASEWEKHRHHTDPRYDNVILHVVLDANAQCTNTKGQVIPTAVIHISESVIKRLETLDIATSSLRCTPEVQEVPLVNIHNILDRLAIDQLRDKVRRLCHQAQEETYHTIFYHAIMRYLGAHANNESMSLVAQSLPYLYLKKHAYDIKALEAMLLGQAGLISEHPRDDYEADLKDEYHFYAQKFGLVPIPQGSFRKLRVRPYSYPARRLAIAAQLMTRETDIISAIAALDLDTVSALLSTSPSEYWCHHYDFGHQSPKAMGGIGSASVHSLLINAIVPTAYQYFFSQGLQDKALESLEWWARLPIESNHIITLCTRHGLTPRHAADTQALLQLYHHYCTQGVCLSCPIAPEIFKVLKSSSDTQ